MMDAHAFQSVGLVWRPVNGSTGADGWTAHAVSKDNVWCRVVTDPEVGSRVFARVYEVDEQYGSVVKVLGEYPSPRAAVEALGLVAS